MKKIINTGLVLHYIFTGYFLLLSTSFVIFVLSYGGMTSASPSQLPSDTAGFLVISFVLMMLVFMTIQMAVVPIAICELFLIVMLGYFIINKKERFFQSRSHLLIATLFFSAVCAFSALLFLLSKESLSLIS